jgi:transposase
MASSRQRRRLPDITEAMTISNPLAAGIDVGATCHAVAIPPHLTPESCRTFGCTTPDLRALASWLLLYGITTVALESTGNYWVQLLHILETAGLQVILVHPAYARQAKRTKYSDLDDSVWLQLMHSYGLLPASFQPPAPFLRLRALWRYRDRLIAEQGRCLQQMQDALDLMNVLLHKAISDIAGVTGLAILRAIVAGERDPARLARYRDRRVQCSTEDLIKALTGDYRDEEVFILGQRLARYDFTKQQLSELDAQIELRLAELQIYLVPPVPPTPLADPAPVTPLGVGKPNVAPPASPRKPRSKQEPAAYDWHARLVALCGEDLTRICGLSVLLVLALISELGVDLSPWESAQQFTAWLGLAPDHRVTGGKVIKRQTRRGKPHAAHFFYMAALAVAKSYTPLGEFYRYQKARMGPRKALTATARKIAILYYHLLKYGPAFVEAGQRRLAENAAARKHRKLRRLAAELGVQILETPRAA